MASFWVGRCSQTPELIDVTRPGWFLFCFAIVEVLRFLLAGRPMASRTRGPLSLLPRDDVQLYLNL